MARTEFQWSSCSTAACLLLGLAHAPAGRCGETPVSVEAFGRLPSLENVAISPDGEKVAFVRTDTDKRNLLIVALAGGKVLGGAHVGDVKLRGIEWIDDDTLLSTISATSLPPPGFLGSKSEWSELLVYTLSKHTLKPVDFAVRDTETFNTVSGETSGRNVAGVTTLFAPGYYVEDRVLPGLFSFPMPDRRARLLVRGHEPSTDWLIDKSGAVAAELTYHDDKKTWDLKALRENRLTQVATGTAAIDTPDLLGFSADGTAIILRLFENGDPVWRPFSLKDYSWGPPLLPETAIYSVVAERLSGRIIGGASNLDKTEYLFFDAELQAHWNAVLRAFPDEAVRLVSHTDDFSRMIVEVFGAKDGYVYALFDWYTHQAVVLGSVYDGVPAPAPVTRVTYPAADGLIIHGLLTLPRGASKDLPLIVLPHGGPAAVDTLRFDWWAQALASQGYAVLQPNYRGSSVDAKFLARGFGEFGRKMQTDLSDGVRYLAKQGVIDPQRVCIVGASYGGYAALAGVTLDPGVYRCAVSVAGLSDLRRMRGWVGENDLRVSQRYWDRFMGVANKDDTALKAISPIEHVDVVNVPMLLIHGRDDTVVPFEQSEVMFNALKRAGKPVQMVTLKHEDHWLSRSDTRLQMLQACVDFLRQQNPPNPATP